MNSLTLEWATIILEMEDVCYSEGIGPNSDIILKYIFKIYPKLKETYGHLIPKEELMNTNMKIFYTMAMLGVLGIWMGGVVILEVTKTEIDRGFYTTISGACMLVLTQMLSSLRNESTNVETIKKVEKVIEDKLP